MTGRKILRILFSASSIGVLVLSVPTTSYAQQDDSSGDTSKAQVDALNGQIKDKLTRVKEIQALVDKYKDRITQQESQQTSLENEVLILDNRITKKQLDVEVTKTELEALQLEIQSLDAQIAQQGDRIGKQKDYAADLIRRIHQADGISELEIMLSKPSLSAFFDRLEEDKRLERDLSDALEQVKGIKQTLEASKQERDAKRVATEDQKKQLNKDELSLEAERNFKISLAAETKNKQSEFERVMYELQQQQQSTSDDISSLETKLKDKLDAVDQSLARGDVLLNWPVDPSRGITATFHDPTYPFKNLFQHPGVDVRASVGTTIKSAAGGYVAWNKQGRLYGNYVMVVHPGNIATVYAHLSKFIAKPDTYVSRGDTIGLTGGMPGQPGAGLSTGPHLHFEVRQNGIPVNPESFLPSIDGN